VAASEEQSRGIQEITTAVSHVDKVTQTNAATAEETASAAEQLLSQAEGIHETPLQLSALVLGAAANSTPPGVEGAF
jgi:methyl-accepting chemotaxis protein